MNKKGTGTLYRDPSGIIRIDIPDHDLRITYADEWIRFQHLYRRGEQRQVEMSISPGFVPVGTINLAADKIEAFKALRRRQQDLVTRKSNTDARAVRFHRELSEMISRQP